jgi:hypothetical protein
MKSTTILRSITSKRILAVSILVVALVIMVPRVIASSEASTGVQPNAVHRHYSGTINPGDMMIHPAMYEQAGARVQVFISWKPTNALITFGLYYGPGHYDGGLASGGYAERILTVTQTGWVQFAVANPNPSTVITYSADVNWP